MDLTTPTKVGPNGCFKADCLTAKSGKREYLHLDTKNEISWTPSLHNKWIKVSWRSYNQSRITQTMTSKTALKNVTKCLQYLDKVKETEVENWDETEHDTGSFPSVWAGKIIKSVIKNHWAANNTDTREREERAKLVIILGWSVFGQQTNWTIGEWTGN